jgi:hypothetical protein
MKSDIEFFTKLMHEKVALEQLKGIVDELPLIEGLPSVMKLDIAKFVGHVNRELGITTRTYEDISRKIINL